MHVGVTQVNRAAQVSSSRSLDFDHAAPISASRKCGPASRKETAEVQYQEASRGLSAIGPLRTIEELTAGLLNAALPSLAIVAFLILP